MNRFLKKLSIFLALPIFLIILIEVICFKLKVPKISYPNIYSKSQNLVPEINSNTILFLGDSRIEYGIKPLVIKNILNDNNEIKVINLAMPGSNGLDILAYLKEKSIYPKIIIIGYSSNNGRNENHGLNKIEYTVRNRKEENAKYHINQNSFVFDYNSIISYVLGEHPLHISHKYDRWGGVNVTDYGDYESKKKVQIKMYKEWSKNYEKERLYAYHSSIKKLKKWFTRGGTIFYGLSMPISTTISKIEEENFNEQNVSELFEKYFDYSKLKYSFDETLADSLYFSDGSHLTPEYAISFSAVFAKELKEQLHNFK